MSRADYLAKYLSGGDLKKTKKKSKKSKLPTSETQVVVGGLPKSSRLIQGEDANEETENPFNAVEDEYAPTSVENVAVSKENAGFRRIDDGTLVTTEVTKETVQAQPETIYRDLTGRIINIEQRKAEIEAEKERKEEEERKVKEQIGSGELDRIEQQKHEDAVAKATRFDYSIDDKSVVDHMKAKAVFDDPLSAFDTSTKQSAPFTTETGRPVYSKGIHANNRFQIKSGHFWDGIDRSNGFEDRLIRKRSEVQVGKIASKVGAESYTEYDYE